jgi:hypothetical protein
MATVKAQDRGGQVDIGRSIALCQRGCDRRCAEPIEIDKQEREIACYVGATNPFTELDAVKNLDYALLIQANVVGPKIAVSLAYPPILDALGEPVFPLLTKLAHRVCDRFELERRQGIAREWLKVVEIAEHDVHLLLCAPRTVGALLGDRSMELDQALCNAIDDRFVNSISLEHAVEHPVRGQTAHQRAVFNRITIATNRNSTMLNGDLGDAEIDSSRQSPVEPDLVFTSRSAELQRRKVDESVVNGPLQFQDSVAGKKDP